MDNKYYLSRIKLKYLFIDKKEITDIIIKIMKNTIEISFELYCTFFKFLVFNESKRDCRIDSHKL